MLQLPQNQSASGRLLPSCCTTEHAKLAQVVQGQFVGGQQWCVRGTGGNEGWMKREGGKVQTFFCTPRPEAGRQPLLKLGRRVGTSCCMLPAGLCRHRWCLLHRRKMDFISISACIVNRAGNTCSRVATALCQWRHLALAAGSAWVEKLRPSVPSLPSPRVHFL